MKIVKKLKNDVFEKKFRGENLLIWDPEWFPTYGLPPPPPPSLDAAIPGTPQQGSAPPARRGASWILRLETRIQVYITQIFQSEIFQL